MSTSRVFSLLLTMLAAALLAVGCGGDDDSGSDDGGSGGADNGSQTDDGGDAGGGGGDMEEARSLFVSSCGGCHALSDAGTTGQVGPDLDASQPDADHVREMIDEGGGAMPAGLLEGEEADSVAEYVADVAGG